ncbi:MAG: GrpB family protein [Proteobacteria bacterium]|nr:GrpB family protein [Pseudomonadota bacterium]
MTDDESLQAAIHEIVAVHAPDPAWPALFVAERERLTTQLPGAFIDIQHIGSTAVAGLAAKPIIDILAGVAPPVNGHPFVRAPRRYGYIDGAEVGSRVLDHRWFMRWSAGRRTHHLHVVEHGSAAWRQRLRFRDALRADPALAARYAALKQALAARYARNRNAYTEGKAAFIASICQ